MFTLSENARTWIELLSLVGGALSFVVAAAAFVVRNSFVTHGALNEALEPLGAQIDDQSERITALEADVKQLPTQRQWTEMVERQTRVEGGMENLNTKITGVHDILERIERPLNVIIDAQLKSAPR
jgi:cell division protein FtsB